MESIFDLEVAIIVYSVISMRWIYMIHLYHKQVLEDSEEYKFKSHPVFKAILFGRAFVLGSVAPIFAFFRPSYFAQFFNGVQSNSSATVIAKGLLGNRRVD